ncbi:unnamed protein product [Ceutorhynchus assimilis]|uniref:Mitochondrial cytochrome c oxidase subunit Vb n=1 Tax=Ceutorhynchus assimilis TaxID=467358 RepID=A0A9P0DFI4_9CUCU|nr:unnamed protein product [Ceutorhynchus assimilis]
MALRVAKLLLNRSTTKRTMSLSSVLSKQKKVIFPDPIDHATGPEKREMLALVAGNDNLWDMKKMRRGAGTRTQPNEIPSAYECRMVGCVCEDESCSINYMWLYKGHPKRCECGHWFQLVQKAPV